MRFVVRLNFIFGIVLCLGVLVLAQEPSSDKQAEKAGDLVAGKAIYLARPTHPRDAWVSGVNGQVRVKIMIDVQGNVIEANATTGDPILHKAAEEAALKSKFTPTTQSGKPIKVTATISFNFNKFDDWEGVGYAISLIENGKAALGYDNRRKDVNWQGLEEERDELHDLQRDVGTDGKSGRATILIQRIGTKLEMWNQVEFWYFRLGILTAKLGDTSERNNDDFMKYLRDLEPLVVSAPPMIPSERLSVLKEVTKLARSKLSKSERTKIVTVLVESYNKKISTM